MDEYINESVEMQDVADPVEEELESAETQEVADPVEESDNSAESTEDHSSGRTEADAAFAEMRRRIQELEAENGDLERRNGAMSGALSRYFEGESDDDLIINANAYADERDPDDVRQEYERNLELEELRMMNEELQEQLTSVEIERLMQDGLREVQELDPNIKSLEELGDTFVDFIANGLTTKQAYYATLAFNNNEKVFAPDAIGKVADTKSERDYFTSEELDALTDEDLNNEKIFEKAMRSLERL